MPNGWHLADSHLLLPSRCHPPNPQPLAHLLIQQVGGNVQVPSGDGMDKRVASCHKVWQGQCHGWLAAGRRGCEPLVEGGWLGGGVGGLRAWAVGRCASLKTCFQAGLQE